MAPVRGGLVAAALAIVYVVWGSTYLGIKIVVEEAPPMTAMGLRFITAGLLLGAVLSLLGGGLARLRVTWRQFAGAAFLGLSLPLLGNGMVAIAEGKGATSGYTALLIAVAPLLIVVFRVVEGDVPRPRTMAGVLLGFLGLGVLVLLGRGAGDFSLVPALIILFASGCWAFGSYVQPRLWLPTDPFVVAVWEMITGGLMMVTLGRLLGERLTFDYGTGTWLAWSYLVVFGSMVAFTSYVWLVANAPISLVATYAYVNPVIAVLLGWLILDEQVTGAIVVGGSIVVGAVALVITSERTPAAAAPAELEPEVVEACVEGDGDEGPTGLSRPDADPRQPTPAPAGPPPTPPRRGS